MIKKKTQNHTLDILKACCAILIVFNHCVFPGEFGNIVKDISRISVPIFFMISGYYVFQNTSDKIISKLKRIFLMFVGACIFWFLYNTIRYAITNHDELKIYLNTFLDFKCIIRFIIFNDNIFKGHLWFLNALLYCYGIEFIKTKLKIANHFKLELVVIIALLLSYFILNALLLNGDYNNAYYIRNFIFFGTPFFLIGKNLHHIDTDKFNNYIFILSCVFAFIFLFIERIIYPSELYISIIIMAIALFSICIKNPNFRNNSLEYIGKNLNIYTYVFHPAVKYIILDIIALLSIGNDIVMYIYPIVALFITIIFSDAIYRMNKYISKIKTT